MEQFKVVKELGRGGYGRALLVKSQITNELRVVKMIDLGTITEEQRKAVRLEQELLARLRHSNIIRYRNCTTSGKKLYILMDYAPGGDLEKFLAARGVDNYMPEEQILDFFVQIALAVKYLHERRVIHRDLKPSNIFIGAGDIVKLGDFGIAKILEHTGDFAQTSIGTPNYCAPELATGHPYGFKADIWSLGCVLYEMMALRRPFEWQDGQDVQELLRRILRNRPAPLPAHYGRDVRDLCMRLLTKNADQRPSIGQIMKHPLVQTKAMALLGRTQARLELFRPIGAVGPKDPGPEVTLAVEGAAPIGRRRTNAKVFKELQSIAGELQGLVGGTKRPVVEVPEAVSRMSPGEFYYIGRLLPLSSVKKEDSLHYKMEALRSFIEEMVGVDEFKRLYDIALRRTPEARARLLELTKTNIYLLQLIMQLVAHENVEDALDPQPRPE